MEYPLSECQVSKYPTVQMIRWNTCCLNACKIWPAATLSSSLVGICLLHSFYVPSIFFLCLPYSFIWHRLNLLFLLGINALLVDITNIEERTTRYSSSVLSSILSSPPLYLFIIVFVPLTLFILKIATRLIVIDAFRYAGRALGVQLAAHIKTQVHSFPESFL